MNTAEPDGVVYQMVLATGEIRGLAPTAAASRKFKVPAKIIPTFGGAAAVGEYFSTSLSGEIPLILEFCEIFNQLGIDFALIFP